MSIGTAAGVTRQLAQSLTTIMGSARSQMVAQNSKGKRMNKQLESKLGHTKRELATANRRIQAIKAINMPDPATQREAAFLAEVARRINEALKA